MVPFTRVLCIVLIMALPGCQYFNKKEDTGTADSTSVAAVADSVILINPEWYYVNEAEDSIFIAPPVPAEFPGGKKALMSFLKEELVYPKQSAESSSEGTVLISFIVDESGEVTNVKVAKGLEDKLLNAEAARVVRNLPYWDPGRAGGKAVKIQYLLPVAFSLEK